MKLFPKKELDLVKLLRDLTKSLNPPRNEGKIPLNTITTSHNIHCEL